MRGSRVDDLVVSSWSSRESCAAVGKENCCFGVQRSPGETECKAHHRERGEERPRECWESLSIVFCLQDCQMIFSSLWTSRLAGKREKESSVRGRRKYIPGFSLSHSLEVTRLALVLSESMC